MSYTKSLYSRYIPEAGDFNVQPTADVMRTVTPARKFSQFGQAPVVAPNSLWSRNVIFTNSPNLSNRELQH
jgi:hypothetical protein